MENKGKKVFQKRFKDITIEKVVCYKNPKHFGCLYLERVNPNHVGIVWGRSRKSKHSNMIRIGKIYFHMLPVVMGLSVAGWFDAMTGYVFGVLASIGFVGLVVGLCASLVVWGFPLLEMSYGKSCKA